MFATATLHGLISPDYSVFSPKRESDVHVVFFERLFKTPDFVDQFAKRSKGIGSGFNRLYTPDFGAVPCVVPPRGEQLAIVRFLDHAERRIQRYIRAKKRLIELLKEQKQAIIHQAVTGQIDVRTGQPYPAYKDSGMERLGEVPEHWEVRRLRTSVRDCRNGIWGRDPDGVDDLYCVRVADFDRVRLRVGNGNLTLRAIAPNERGNRLLRSGDLLLEKSGGGDQQPVGVVIAYQRNDEAVCSNFIARMPVSPSCDPGFLTYLHSYLYAIRLNVRSIKQTTGIQNLDSNSYLGERVAFPPRDSQVTIANYLDRLTSDTVSATTQMRSQIGLLRDYRTRLIADVVTGKLDVCRAAAALADTVPVGTADTRDTTPESEAKPEVVLQPPHP